MSDTIISFKKKDGKLVLDGFQSKIAYKQFLDSIEEGQEVHASLEAITEQRSQAQLTRVHAMIRELSVFTGENFETLKATMKEQCGLDKSFSKCSKVELDFVIQNMMKIGADIGYYFRA